MKSKIILFIIVTCLGVIAVAGIQLKQAAAQKITLGEILKEEPADIVQHDPYEPPSEESKTNLVSSNSDQQKTNDEIIDEARELLDIGVQRYLTGGWLHIVFRTESFVTESETLPDGSPIPTESTTESWKLLDEQGFALKIVTIDDTGDPRTSQTTVYQDGVWKNLALNTETTDSEKYKLTLDSNFLGSAVAYKDTVELHTEESELNGQKVVVYSMTESYKEPLYYDNSSTAVVASIGKYYFSLETGVLLKLERYYLYPNGELQLVRQITTLLIEKVDTLPSNILALLGK